MKALLLVSLVTTGFLVGCISSNIPSFAPKTQLRLTMSSPFTNSNDKMYIVKVTPELRRYCGELKQGQYAMWSDSCDFGSNPPSVLNLEYILVQAKQDEFKNLSSKQIVDISARYIQSLPPSAWRTYTINPKQLLEKGRSMPVYVGFPNEPYAKNDPKRFNYGTRVIVTLYVDGNGNISQEIEHKPISRDRFQ